MTKPTLKQLDTLRQTGFRPQVVGCFVNDRRILLVFKKKHRLWQLPQGGIDNCEKPEDALIREMTEELGEDFLAAAGQKYTLLGEDQVEFPRQTKGLRQLTTDDGEEITLKGKHYFFYAIPTQTTKINLNQTEFDDYVWVNYKPAIFLAGKIYQHGKRRVTEKALSLLLDSGLLT